MTDLLSNEKAARSPAIIRDQLAVDLLTNLTATRRLAPFMHREHTLGSAAAVQDVPASSLAYWVKRFLRAGLLEVVRLESRAGKPIPVYRAVASEFHVPLDAMPLGTQEEFLHGGRRHVFEEFAAAVDTAGRRWSDSGLRIRSDSTKGVEITFIEPEGGTPAPVTEWWGSVTLTGAEAVEVQSTLDALLQRVTTQRTSEGGRRYMMVFGLAPAPRRR